jgi:SRF-type transcription factor (DNA-binding and dimerisation domain)
MGTTRDPETKTKTLMTTKKRRAARKSVLSPLHLNSFANLLGRKIEIAFIKDKSRRHITFSKRKAGIMKKVSITIL